MKKLLVCLLIAAFTSGGIPVVFAADSTTKQELDHQKFKARWEYDEKIKELKRDYNGDELEQRLQQAESEYEAKTKMLDKKKKEALDREDIDE